MSSHPPDADAMTRRLQTIPFIRAVGMQAVSSSEGHATTSAAVGPSLRSASGSLSTGVAAAIIDQAGSSAIWTTLGLQMPHSTVSLSISFADETRAAAVQADAYLPAMAHGLGHTRVALSDTATGRYLAQGLVTFMLGVYPGDGALSAVLGEVDPASLDGDPIDDLRGDAFFEALGFEAVDGGLTLGYRSNLVGSRGPVALHGGVLAAGLIAASERLVPANGPLRLAHLTVDYLRSALARPTVFTAQLVHASRKTMTIRADAVQDGGARLAATATTRFVAAPDPTPEASS